MHQTPFQHRLWVVATEAHAAADRADARILMDMIATIDAANYDGIAQMTVALQSKYRDRLGPVPTQRSLDAHAPGNGV